MTQTSTNLHDINAVTINTDLFGGQYVVLPDGHTLNGSLADFRRFAHALGNAAADFQADSSAG